MNKPHHKYICIEGNIGAGKTTLTKRLSNHWDALPVFEQFTDNPFLPYFYEAPDRYAFQVELFFMIERHKQLREVDPANNLFGETIVADYFFTKTLLFAGHNLEKHEFTLFKHLYDILEKSAPNPDLLIYLHRSVDSLMKTIRDRGRSIEQSIKSDYLAEIQNAYFEFFKHEVHFPILILDVEDLDFEAREKDFHQILEWSAREYKPGVHRIRLVS